MRLLKFPRSRITLIRAIGPCVVLAAAALSPPFGCGAENGAEADLTSLSIEELMDLRVVSSASFFPQPLTRAPSKATIITREDIKRYGYRDLADILKSVGGFYVTDDRNYSYLGVRGFSRPGDYNTRFLFLLDGARLNDNIYDSSALEASPDVDLIDRIEVIPGPSSSLYGANAFFGILDIITVTGKTLGGTELSASAGNLESRSVRASYGRLLPGGMDILVSVSRHESNGQDKLFFEEFDSPSTNNGIARARDGEKYDNAVFKLSGKELSLEINRVKREKTVPTASFSTVFNDPRNKTIDEWRGATLKYERQPSAAHTGLMGRLDYGYYNFDGGYVYDYPPVALNKDIARGRWLSAGARLSTEFAGGTRFVAGAEYRNNIRQDQSNYTLSPYALYLDDKRKSENTGVYFLGEFIMGGGLILNAGLRYDDYSTFGSTLNPRAAFIYERSRETTFKFIYGRAFRAPSAYESYYNDGSITQKTNPSLGPETINTFEAVAEKRFGSLLMVSASAFLYRINDLISLTTDPFDGLLIFENVDNVEAGGVEVEAEKKWKNAVGIKISYTLAKARDSGTGRALTNSPRHLAKLNLTTPLIGERVVSGMEFQYVGRRKTPKGGEAGGFMTANLTISGKDFPLKGLSLGISAYNILDKKYSDPASLEHAEDSIEQDGRTFRVKMSYAF